MSLKHVAGAADPLLPSLPQAKILICASSYSPTLR